MLQAIRAVKSIRLQINGDVDDCLLSGAVHRHHSSYGLPYSKCVVLERKFSGNISGPYAVEDDATTINRRLSPQPANAKNNALCVLGEP